MSAPRAFFLFSEAHPGPKPGPAAPTKKRQKNLRKSPHDRQDLKLGLAPNGRMSANWRRAALLIHLFCLVLSSAFVLAQTGAQANAARRAMTVQTERPPRMDGTLDDALWQTAPAVDDFRQREPLETQPATEKTEVHILYDSRHIYFLLIW